MRQRSRWKIFQLLILIIQITKSLAEEDGSRSRNALFSPRMDYNQWKPLGRGDPLKNDPTFDYVPPVLDHVHFWREPESRSQAPSSTAENGQKTEILILGVSSKKPATPSKQTPITASDRRDTAYDSYSKYHQEKNYYGQHPNQRIARPNYFPSMTSQIIPSLMNFANQVLDRTAFSKNQETRMPYTVLMPPPVVTKDQAIEPQFVASSVTTPMTKKPYSKFTPTQYYSSTVSPRTYTTVTVQESNLIYQSSSLGSRNEFEAVPSVGWELPSTTEPVSNFMHQSSNLSPPKSFIRIQFAPHNYSNKILEASGSSHDINYVTPPPLDDTHVTFKGQVSDDNDISDSYVKIEKPQAQMDHMGVEINNVHPMPILYSNSEPFRASQDFPPLSMQTIRDMETMKPPPVTQSPVYTRPTHPVINALKKEYITDDQEASNYIGSSSSISQNFVTTTKLDPHPSPTTIFSTEINNVLPDVEMTTLPSSPSSSVTPITTTDSSTTVQTLTTDPLFKHYKQPIEPLRGPLYLIIQGHSKVKTYKPAKQIDGIMVQETNEIPYVKDVDFNIKHLHGFEEKNDFLEKADKIAKQRQARTGNLQTLKHVVQTGLGAIDFSDGKEAEIRMRIDDDLEETELKAGYEVVDSKDVTSEKYHRGIVEEARKLA